MAEPQPLHQPPPPPPWPTPQQQIELEQLRETTEVQQRTLRFLLSNWEALVAQAAVSIGAPQTLAQNAKIPAGQWLCINPATGNIATMQITTVTPPPTLTITAPGPFVSDGSATVTLATGITIVPVLGG